MKKRVVSKMDMFLQVKKVIHKHSLSWTGIVPFETAYTNFKDQLDELNDLSYEQNNATLGVSSNKNAVRTKTTTKAMEMIGILRAFAFASENEELKSQLYITPTDLSKASKLRLIQLIDRILEKAILYLGDLNEYGITQAKIDLLQELRDEVHIAVNSPRSAIIERKSLTLSIEERVVSLDKIVRWQLDMFVEAFKNEYPKFYKDYKGARVIVDPSIKKKVNPTKQLPPSNQDQESPNSNSMY